MNAIKLKSVLNDIRQRPLKEMILWWEGKRLVYNILLIGLSTLLLYSYWNYPAKTIIGSDKIVLSSIFFVLGANLLYTLSWISGVIVFYISQKTILSSKRKRWILFILGTVFTLLWTNLKYALQFDVFFAH